MRWCSYRNWHLAMASSNNQQPFWQRGDIWCIGCCCYGLLLLPAVAVLTWIFVTTAWNVDTCEAGTPWGGRPQQYTCYPVTDGMDGVPCDRCACIRSPLVWPNVDWSQSQSYYYCDPTDFGGQFVFLILFLIGVVIVSLCFGTKAMIDAFRDHRHWTIGSRPIEQPQPTNDQRP